MSQQYKGKDIITGYWVYGPLYTDDTGCYIDDIESGLVQVECDSVELVGEEK